MGPKVSVQLGHQACLSEGQPFLEMEWCTFVVSNSQSVSCTLRCFNTHIGERGACLSVRPVVSLRPSGCVSPSVRSSLSVCLVVSLRMCALAGRGPSAGRIGGPDRQAPPGTARHRPAPPGTARHRPAPPGTARHCPAPPGRHRQAPQGTPRHPGHRQHRQHRPPGGPAALNDLHSFCVMLNCDSRFAWFNLIQRRCADESPQV